MHTGKFFILAGFLLMLLACGDGGQGEKSSEPEYSIATNANSLQFEMYEGGSVPATQTITVTFKGDGVLVGPPPSMEWPDWLSVREVSHTNTQAVFEIGVESFIILSANRYSAPIRFVTGKSDGSVVKYKNVQITLDVLQAFGLHASNSLEFNAMTSVLPAQGHSFTIKGVRANWQIRSDASWLSFSNTSGSGPATITLNADASELSEGEYSATIYVDDSDSGRTETLDASLTVRNEPVATALPESTPNSYDFMMQDAYTDTERGLLYSIDYNSKRLYRIDLESGLALDYMGFAYSPTAVAASPDGLYLYIGFELGDYWYYAGTDIKPGYVGIYDLTNERLLNYFSTDAVPYDMAVAFDNTLVLSTRYTQHDYLRIIDLDTHLSIFDFGAGQPTIAAAHKIAAHPNEAIIYSTSTSSWPSSINKARFEAPWGVTEHVDSPYHGDYREGAGVWLFPDLQKVLTGEGDVFSSDDLTYQGSVLPAHSNAVAPPFFEEEILSAVFSASGDALLVATNYRGFHIYNTADFSLQSELLANASADELNSTADQVRTAEVFYYANTAMALNCAVNHCDLLTLE